MTQPTLTEQVRQALDQGMAVLALESTIITHGMPWPRNLETAQAAEQAVRDTGATPATIALLDGRIKVGLSGRELERLAKSAGDAGKCSRRDLPFLVGTTVAATMIIARQAGIRVFATGGIGGVHRGGATSLDVSADLQELARTPVAVVCAGPKAILDIGLTREYLETHGVPVVGYRTDDLPAFWSRKSGYPVDYRLDSPEAIAAALDVQRDLGLSSGTVIANPVPADWALERSELESVIEVAAREALEAGVSGKDLTPFLLQRIEQLTGGGSLETNVRLMIENARLGGKIAVALAARQAAEA